MDRSFAGAPGRARPGPAGLHVAGATSPEPAAYGRPTSYLMTQRMERPRLCCGKGVGVRDLWAVGCISLGSFSTRSTQMVGDSRRSTARETTVPSRSFRRA